MKRFDPSSMPDTTSPTVRSLRAFVEHAIEEEIEKAEKEHGYDSAEMVEKYLRSLAYTIFHKNPD
jgi:glutamyl-tRNA reductase